MNFDPKTELNPNPILIGVALLVLAGIGTVGMIIHTGDPKAEPAPAAAGGEAPAAPAAE